MWLIVFSLSPHHLHLLFCCVLSILALILLVLMALFCVAVRRYSAILLRFLFFTLVHVFTCEMSLVSCFKRKLELFFFPCLFFGYFRSVDPHILSIVSSGYNQSASALFYIAFKSLMLVSPLPPFLTHILCQRHLLDIIPYAWSLVFLFSGPFFRFIFWSTSIMVPSILRGDSLGIYPFDKVCCYIILCRVASWFSWDTLFYFFFFHPHGVSFHYSQISVGFLFN